jgi:CBS domain containing-hemolysin-like protein
MPQEGDRFDAHGIRAEVLDVEGNRLRRLRLTRLTDDDLPLASDEVVSRES